MCGIAGGINVNNLKIINILEKTSHRGTDNYHIKSNGNVIMGINILPLYNGKSKNQPISNLESVFVCNAEIYNCKEISKKYSIERYEYMTDSEILAQLMKLECFDYNELNGQFAFAYAKNNELILVRDYPGISPLFYARKEESFAFSSESKGLVAAGFEDIQVVKPGTKVVIRQGKIEIKSWINFKKINILNPINELDEHMNNIIRSQIQHGTVRNKIGIMLSGGVDSALLAYYLSLYNKDVHAFIIEGQDSKYAKIVSKYLKINYTIIKAEEIYNQKSNIYKPEQYNKQFYELNNSLYVPSYIIAEHASNRGVNIMFAGDGLDEIFGGYSIYPKYPGNINIITKNIVDLMHAFSLERLDLALMSHTIETRVPFVNKSIIEFGLSLDEQYKIKDGHEKWIIHKIAEKYLPTEIAWREKCPMQVSTNSYQVIYKKLWKNSMFN
ncbi:asparagine synthetase B family protein [Clostridium sporogenes]|uniref:asparagine synthetase B family protein n=1 Tax=Clostridium sporogenes TaxID=1509 RepID=UPI0006B266AD|nr:asparagine synthase-related protein [Clostridium sporogenes]KOY65416.1 hypothetical protein AN649_13130 [Clostridium sporogenes]MDS1006653.1 asparagine synthase-related protein [Clostridium sporogenes]